MKIKNIIQLLAFAGLAGSLFGQMAPPGSAPAPGEQPDEIDQLAEMIGLTDEQETEIRGVVDEITPQIQELQMEAQALQAELQEKGGPDFDEAGIREVATELGEVSGELAALSTIMQSKVQSIFTEEQRAELERQQQEQMRRQQQMQQQMQQRMQQQMQQQQGPPQQMQQQQRPQQ